MRKINLRDLYPSLYAHDLLLELDDAQAEEILQAFAGFRAQAHAQRVRERRRRKLAQQLLQLDGQPDREANMDLYDALKKLTAKQLRRLYAHYIFGYSFVEIARAEDVKPYVVQKSVEKALKKLNDSLKSF